MCTIEKRQTQPERNTAVRDFEHLSSVRRTRIRFIDKIVGTTRRIVLTKLDAQPIFSTAASMDTIVVIGYHASRVTLRGSLRSSCASQQLSVPCARSIAAVERTGRTNFPLFGSPKFRRKNNTPCIAPRRSLRSRTLRLKLMSRITHLPIRCLISRPSWGKRHIP